MKPAHALAVLIVGLAIFLVVSAWRMQQPVPPSPGGVTCDFHDAGVCSGDCPKGQVCTSSGPTVCACMPESGSPFCGFNDAHACAGPCPEGQECTQRGPTVCTCLLVAP